MILKLQKALSNVFHGKKYYRYSVTLPREFIRDLGWEKHEYVEAIKKKDHILIKRVGKNGRRS